MGASIVKVYGDKATWTVTGTSDANTAKTITKTGVAGYRHVVTSFEVVVRGATVGADTSVALKDGSTVKWQSYFGVGAVRGERVGATFPHGIEMSAYGTVTLVVGAGGASVITELNMAGHTELA
jgi:hypothetical protein